jgi:hypothetical protein
MKTFEAKDLKLILDKTKGALNSAVVVAKDKIISMHNHSCTKCLVDIKFLHLFDIQETSKLYTFPIFFPKNRRFWDITFFPKNRRLDWIGFLPLDKA